MILVDSNILLDVLTEDPEWCAWSSRTLVECRDQDTLAINPIILAEVAPHCPSWEILEAAVSPADYQRAELPWRAAFRAGTAFRDYRLRGGNRHSPLPDFYIGAHAETAGMRLLTRDVARYRTYFPKVPLIAPPG